MFKFIFNLRRNERLSSNSRQSLGTGFKKSSSNGSRHDSWQYNFNKNTLSVSSCQNCELIDWGGPINCSLNSDNSCTWRCILQSSPTASTTTYCNGIPPANALII
jgi:hypothetical protein